MWKNNEKWKQIKSSSIFIMITICFLVGKITCRAVDDYDEVVSDYCRHTKQPNMQVYEINTYIDKYLEYKEQVEYYKNLLDNADLSASMKANAQKSYEENLLLMNCYRFYYDNKTFCINQSNYENEYAFILSYLEIPVYQKQLSYYEAVLKQQEENLKLAKKKYKKGLLTHANVVACKEERQDTKDEIAKIKDTLISLQNTVKQELQQPNYVFDTTLKNCVLISEGYANTIFSHSFNVFLLDNYCDAYYIYP